VLVIVLFPFVAFSEPSKKHPAPCQIAYPSDAAIEWDCRTLRSGESLEKLFGERWIDVARFNRIDRRHARSGTSLKVPKHLEELASFTPLPLEYPPAESESQFILIDLAEQFLGAYEYAPYALPSPSCPATAGTKPRPANFD